MERASEHHGNVVVVVKQSVFTVVENHVVHWWKVMFADEEFAAFAWNDRKVMDSVFVLHRQRVLAGLHTRKSTVGFRLSEILKL